MRKNQPEGPAVFMRSVGLVAVRHSRSCLLTAKTEGVVGHERQESKRETISGLVLNHILFSQMHIVSLSGFGLTSLN